MMYESCDKSCTLKFFVTVKCRFQIEPIICMIKRCSNVYGRNAGFTCIIAISPTLSFCLACLINTCLMNMGRIDTSRFA